MKKAGNQADRWWEDESHIDEIFYPPIVLIPDRKVRTTMSKET